jgi:hypothetical protein
MDRVSPHPRVEVGQNTSSVDLLAVRDDERRSQHPGVYNWATLFLRDINVMTWLSTLGTSQMRE